MFYIISFIFLIAGLITHNDFNQFVILCGLSGIFAIAGSIGSLSNSIRDIFNGSLKYQIKNYRDGSSEIKFNNENENE